ncbi:MAG: hypothetical protein FVQ80_13990 [Planctomycetes bacterium]|nr:hypothetical protein [Planctomycetota bacterium]
MKERRERDWKTFYELHENDFVKIMREINGLPQEAQWDALNNFLKKAYSLKKYAEINPESPLNSTVLITKLEKFITNLKKETPEKIETDSSHTRNKEKGPTDTNHQPYKSGEYLQITTKMSEDTFQDFLNDLAEKSFITKETAKSSKEVYHDNFASPRTPCGKMKINWWSGRIGGWGCYHYLFKYGISRSGLFPAEMGYARFFATHFLFDGQEKTEKQVWNGCDSASKTELEKEKKDALNDIIEKYLKR